MSFNPDDAGEAQHLGNDDQEAIINNLKEENSNLKSQIDDLTRRLARYEIHQNSSDEGNEADEADEGGEADQNDSQAARRTNNRGRKSIPFHRRNPKQHQGRIAYLLKLLEKRSAHRWNQDLIADLQSYCVSDESFLKQALQTYLGDDTIDLDTFIAILQSH